MRTRNLFVCSLPLLATAGCVLPDQVTQLQKDVANVRQELREMKDEQAENREQLERVEAAIGEEGSTVTRREFADMQATVHDAARGIAIVEERLNDSHRRMDRISETLEEVRELARRGPAGSAVPPGDDGPADGGPGDLDAPTTGGAGAGLDALPDPTTLYNAAYADFSKGNYALAVSGFEEYVSRYADSDLADNAIYWIGECHFSQASFANSIEAFDRLLERYPDSDRAAAADLKKGLAFLEQNDVAQAIVQLQHVVETYPRSDESRVARDKLASMGHAVSDS